MFAYDHCDGTHVDVAGRRNERREDKPVLMLHRLAYRYNFCTGEMERAYEGTSVVLPICDKGSDPRMDFVAVMSVEKDAAVYPALQYIDNDKLRVSDRRETARISLHTDADSSIKLSKQIIGNIFSIVNIYSKQKT